MYVLVFYRDRVNSQLFGNKMYCIESILDFVDFGIFSDTTRRCNVSGQIERRDTCQTLLSVINTSTLRLILFTMYYLELDQLIGQPMTNNL